jgi:hypothetical protein
MILVGKALLLKFKAGLGNYPGGNYPGEKNAPSGVNDVLWLIFG